MKFVFFGKKISEKMQKLFIASDFNRYLTKPNFEIINSEFWLLNSEFFFLFRLVRVRYLKEEKILTFFMKIKTWIPRFVSGDEKFFAEGNHDNALRQCMVRLRTGNAEYDLKYTACLKKHGITDVLGSPLCMRFLVTVCLDVGWVEVRNPTVSFGLNPTKNIHYV